MTPPYESSDLHQVKANAETPYLWVVLMQVITLPSRINAHQTSAVVTLYGQLYVRVPIADTKSP
jgi:hypothetical protein